MPIKTFSDDEKAAIKAEASTRFGGRDAAMVCNLGDPINETVVVAPFDRAAYQAYWHASLKDKQSAYATAWVGRRLWPSLGDLAAIQQAWAAAPEKVAERLDAQSLGPGGLTTADVWAPPTVEQEQAVMARASADAKDPDWSGLLPRGLTLAVARETAEKHRGRRLWLVQNGDYAILLRTPDPGMWIAANATWDGAMKRGVGAIDAADPFVIDAVAWSSEPLTGGSAMLDRHPQRWFDLWATYKLAGGEGAAARTFLL